MKTKAGTIVVGVDGSESSKRAVAWAADQAVAERRALTLAHAIHAVTPAYVDAAIVYPEEARSILMSEGRKILGAAHKQVEATAPDLEVHEVLEFLDPREMLLEMSQDAAMMVLGSRGRGQIRSLLLGSVGVALVRHAHCPVVVHRPGNAGDVRHGIVVGVEASEESGTVLEFAYREASLRDLPLTVLHCYWDIQAGTSAAGIVYDSIVDVEGERVALAELMAGMSEKYPDVAVSRRMARGLPHEVLARLGERMNLIVVGAHQANRVSQMVFGSVSVALVERATCPVAVVPVSTPQ
jgi:nucleotide-binding universal stress UspA family protein